MGSPEQAPCLRPFYTRRGDWGDNCLTSGWGDYLDNATDVELESLAVIARMRVV